MPRTSTEGKTLKVCQRNHSRVTRCPECSAASNRRGAAKRRLNPENRAKDAEYYRNWRKANPEKYTAYREENKDKIRAQARARILKQRYGITVEQYDLMLLAQEGKCFICREPPNEENTRNGFFPVDHDHATGENRGLLCELCNKGLGLFKDDINRLERAAEYLREYR